MSVPPACCTNSAGENVLPWQTQTMLTSSHFEYLYKNPFTLFPFGPFPFVDTYGIWDKDNGFLTGIEMVCVAVVVEVTAESSLGCIGFCWLCVSFPLLNCLDEAICSGWFLLRLISLEFFNLICSVNELAECWLWLLVLPPSSVKTKAKILDYDVWL